MKCSYISRPFEIILNAVEECAQSAGEGCLDCPVRASCVEYWDAMCSYPIYLGDVPRHLAVFAQFRELRDQLRPAAKMPCTAPMKRTMRPKTTPALMG